MIKKLLLIACMILPFVVFSQKAERENVLVEVITGTW